MNILADSVDCEASKEVEDDLKPKPGVNKDTKFCTRPDQQVVDSMNDSSVFDNRLTASTVANQGASAMEPSKPKNTYVCFAEQHGKHCDDILTSAVSDWNAQAPPELESTTKQHPTISAHPEVEQNGSLNNSFAEARTSKPSLTPSEEKLNPISNKPDPYSYNFESSPSADGEDDEESKIATTGDTDFKTDRNHEVMVAGLKGTEEKNCVVSRDVGKDLGESSSELHRRNKEPSGEEVIGASQPLDLSTRANGDAGPNATTHDDPLSTSCRALENGHELLENLGFDDVLLTTAALLFMTHTAIIPASVACSESLSDPWKSIINHYKSVLTWALLEETAYRRDSNTEQVQYDPKLLNSPEIASPLHPLRQSVLVLKGFFLRDLSGSKRAATDAPDNAASDDERPEPITDGEVEDLAARELQLRKIQLPFESTSSMLSSSMQQWCAITQPAQLADLLSCMAPRGIRERNLSKSIKRSEEFVHHSLQVGTKIMSNFINPGKMNENAPRFLRVRSRRGKGRGNNASSAQLHTVPSRTESCVQPTEPDTECDPIGLGETGPGAWHNSEPTFPCPANENYGLDGEDPNSVYGENPPLILEHRLRRRPQNKTEPAGSVAERLEKRPGVSGFKAQALQNSGRSLHEVMGSGDPVFVSECCFLEEVEALEDRVLHASLQMKGWQAPVKVLDDETIHLLPRTTPKRSRFEHWPLDLAKIRLLGLESHLERRYLLPPLNSEVHLDVVPEPESGLAVDSNRGFADLTDQETESESGFGGGPGSESTNTSLRDGDSGHINTTHHHQPVIRRIVGKPLSQESCSLPVSHVGTSFYQPAELRDTMGGSYWLGTPSTEQIPPGLLEWRHRVHRANDLDAMRACMDELVSAIAWEKSIMKVLCQICRRDNNEAQLLLCDGCDHGYHTYCFRPPLTNIPPGDWFCNDCVSKATGKPICFVCGSTQPSSTSSNVTADNTHRMLTCEKCSRSVHAQCSRPPMSRAPRRWLCANCHTGAAKACKGNSTPAADAMTLSASCLAGRSSKKLDSMAETDIPVVSKDTRKKPPQPPISASVASQQSFPRFTLDPKTAKTKRLNKTRQIGTGLLNKIKQQQSKRRANLARQQSQVGTGQRGVDRKPKGHRRGRPHLGRTLTSHRRDNSDKLRVDAGKPQASDDDLFSACASPARSQMTSSGSDLDLVQRHPLSQSQLNWMRTATEDLIRHEASWAFRKPVNVKQIPFYRKIIKHPMDLSTILRKTGHPCAYSSIEQWQKDVRLIFNNCEIFNEDDSDVGRAGHTMRAYFESRWSTPPKCMDSDSTEQAGGLPNTTCKPSEDHQEQMQSRNSSPSDFAQVHTSRFSSFDPKPEGRSIMPLSGESSQYDQDKTTFDPPSPVRSVDSDSRSSGFSGFEQNELTLDLPLNNPQSPTPSVGGVAPALQPVSTPLQTHSTSTMPSEACLPVTSSPLQ